MDKKQTIIVIVLTVIVIGGLVVGTLIWHGTPSGPTPGGGSVSSSGTAANFPPGSAVSGTQMLYNSAVPADATETKPLNSAPAAQNTTAMQNSYSIQINAAGFSPQTVTVREGNIIHISLTAFGGDYDFIIPWNGIYADVAPGDAKTVSFGATTPGTYVFSCRDHCPASGKISGEIIVLPK